MTAINTNVASLRTQVALMQNSRGLYSTMQQLATGKRLNSAADDAAGIAIVANMNGQVRSLNQEIRNANDGISLLQTADSATEQVTQMLQRMRELVSQALNGTYSTSDVANMGSEVSALQSEIDRVSTDTSWNGTTLLDGTYSGKTIQISDSNALTLSTGNMKTTNLGIDDTVVNFGTSTAPLTISSSWIGLIDKAITTVSTARASMGAMINRLNYAVDNLTNTSTNLSASASRIEDTDYSAATSQLAKHQILQQAATAMLAQANQQPQLVLSLLK